MAFLFDTVAEYTAEIETYRALLLKSAQAEDWRLNTSQSDQRVRMNMGEIREYIKQLVVERTALSQRLSGAGVTSIVPRRTY
jgi:hypothetical protein